MGACRLTGEITMAMSRRLVLPIAGASLAAMLASSPAIAQPRDHREGRAEREARAETVLDARISARDALRIAEEAGYRGIHKLEWERELWKIDAFDAQRVRVKLYIDGQSGALVRRTRR
jgi:hypothetical protein